MQTNGGDRAITFVGATLVLPGDVVENASVSVRGGLIEAIEPEGTGKDVVVCNGDVLMPGIVDVHTDHFEKHIFPRAHVRWDALRAALSHDAQMIGAGTTTSLASLTVGNAVADIDRHSILLPMIEALEHGHREKMFRAEHLVHLRCETADDETTRLVRETVDGPLVRVASFMDHSPGVRQNRDLEKYITRRMAAMKASRAEVEAEVKKAQSRAAESTLRVRAELGEIVVSRGLPLMSHDDTTTEDVAAGAREGATVSEFPTTQEAARAAKATNMLVVAGAPNYLRGGSQSGNVAVADLLEEGLVDILASDYVPRSILDAVFAIADDQALPYSLSDTARMATRTAARSVGLHDRGSIEPGQRADLIQVARAAGQPFVRAAWREGNRVA